MISLHTARELLDFAGGTATLPSRISRAQADAQLEGAVAIHNLLETRGVAYLADEVGMGKTYVALGAYALFRHFDPNFRLLVIAPKENIQDKWRKELGNFVRNNVLFADQRIKAIHQAPARPAIRCDNLLELVHQTALDPDRDFFTRLTSFSFGLPEGDSAPWARKRDQLLRTLPWLDRGLFDLRARSSFKENFARAVCCALPVFDLVIVDEAHHLKAGPDSKSWRNRLVALAMGCDRDGQPSSRFPHYGPRAKRLLLLSATPLEDDYRHVWNQLAVFGMEDVADGLQDPERPEAEKKEILSRFLIRRVNTLKVGKRSLTRNLYRREWRNGGVEVHDEPLATPDARQQLVVALVQKKVSELLESERFKRSFQIGMLASFESFLQTAKVRSADDTVFDDGDQTDDDAEREGIDVGAVNGLAASYWRRFGEDLPHPKMDALVRTLRETFKTGEKALIFVRRVDSVRELRQKLEAEYDHSLMAKLRNEIAPTLLPELERVLGRYRGERRTTAHRKQPSRGEQADGNADLDDGGEPARPIEENRGGSETLFAWFFRGEGPPGVFSGAQLALRLNAPRYSLSSFFLDNWVASLLEVAPGVVFAALQRALGHPEEELRATLERRAGSVLKAIARNTHEEIYLAFQYAALSLLAERHDEMGRRAGIVLDELFDQVETGGRKVQLARWLETPTFFTELRKRPELKDAIWPDEAPEDFVRRFRRRERRRELVASICRLGHSLIDLWTLYVNHLERLDLGGAERVDHDPVRMASAFLDLLERQRGDVGFSAWYELSEASRHFDLILDTNASTLWERPLAEVTTELGKLLREQQPVGGMSGVVNRTLVKQFRMPGYPLVLVTTDILQEGEDLHLFCSRVYHYGISWMPSSMEQRIGRIDRVRSHTERRLTAEDTVDGENLLQVFYPYLGETVEVFQVERVFARLNRFMRLMHQGLGGAEEDRERKIDLEFEAQQRPRELQQLVEPLESAFPVKRSMITAPSRRLAVDRKSERAILERFQSLREALCASQLIEWHPKGAENSLIGTLVGSRRQPFTLLLHSICGFLNVRCVSPVGHVAQADFAKVTREARLLQVRIAVVYDKRFEEYDLTAEGDVLLGSKQSDTARVKWLLETVTSAADRLEQVLLGVDADPDRFHDGLGEEAGFER